MRVTLAISVTAITIPVRAQISSPAAPPQRPAAVYSGGSYPFPAPTPRDAYREGLINRWQLEQLEGPLPPAMQGPSPDGTRGGDGGGSGGFGG
jgi:hypothetical protein